MATKTTSERMGLAARPGLRVWAAKLATAAALVSLLSGSIGAGAANALDPALQHTASRQGPAVRALDEARVDPVMITAASRAPSSPVRLANTEPRLAGRAARAGPAPAASWTAADAQAEHKAMREAQVGRKAAASKLTPKLTTRERYLAAKYRQLEQ